MRSVSENKRAKILVGIINKEDEAKYTSAVNEVATALHFSGLGHGTARQNYMTYFGFNEIGKVVTMSLIPGALEHNILSNVGHKLRLYLVGKGIAFTIPVSCISSIINDAIVSGIDKSEKVTSMGGLSKKKGSERMHELVISVVSTKFTDAAIEAARAAGATGATVFRTKSVDNRRAEQRIGTAIDGETDTVFFLTNLEYRTKIMEAVRDVAGLKTEGGAVIFSVPVDDLVGIGRFEDYVDGEEETE